MAKITYQLTIISDHDPGKLIGEIGISLQRNPYILQVEVSDPIEYEALDTTSVRLSTVIEKLYAHDELAAREFEKLSQSVYEDSCWDDAPGADVRLEEARKDLLNHAEVILGAYEEV